MTEKNMQTLFGKYLQKRPPSETEMYELKICKQKSLPFSKVAPHQIKALLEAEGKGLYHKISDQPIFAGMKTRFTAPKPFDCFYTVNAKSYVVIWFYVPRTPKVFYKIRVLDFLELKRTAGRKSITRDMLEEKGIAIHI